MLIEHLKRTEESGKRRSYVRRTSPHLTKIARAKLVCNRDRGSAHRPVFVRALRPSDALAGVNPQGEAH
jgi:hypothetical protein